MEEHSRVNKCRSVYKRRGYVFVRFVNVIIVDGFS
jgi:hypothetical protein